MWVLLELGADEHARTLDGRTALHVAAAQGHVELVQVSEDSRPAVGF